MAQNKKYNKSGNRSNNNRNYDNRNRNNRNNDNRNRDNKNRDNQQSNKQDVPKQGGAPKPQTQSKTESSNDLIIFVIFLVSLAALGLANKFYFTADQKNSLYGTTTNLKFMKEGKLHFLDAQTGKPIVGIDIEVAKSSYEIEKGLMHRRSLPANGGMLFVFDDEHYRTFWMKNTYIALDILFVNANKEIIRIRKNAQPLSELSIPSGGKAKYVVEVLAGFTDAYQLHLGDHIDFDY